MLKHPRKLFAAALASASIAFSAGAANYYIDFAGGDNTADGLSHKTAWKHSPGDKNATDKPKDAKLEPGDTVIFKGGVHYYGSLELAVAGKEGKPITFDGNSAGTFGEGKAILDGGKEITGWKRVESAEEVQGNPKWKEIFYADVDVDITKAFENKGGWPRNETPYRQVSLYSENGVLPNSQAPKPSDPFFALTAGQFYKTQHQIGNSYPHKVYYEEGTIGNSSLPLLPIIHGYRQTSPVIEPVNGGAVSFELEKPETISGFGVMLHGGAAVPTHIALLADGKEVSRIVPDGKNAGLQKFDLPQPVTAAKLTFKLLHSAPKPLAWTKIQQFAAFDAEGKNIFQREVSSYIIDEKNLVHEDPDYYKGMVVAFHAGANHIYSTIIDKYEPELHKIHFKFWPYTTYAHTSYALLNSPRLVEKPGEWCVKPIANKRSRIYFLPENIEGEQFTPPAFCQQSRAISVNSSASHLRFHNFRIIRYNGGGGIFVGTRSKDIGIADCEVTMTSGSGAIFAGHSDDITVDNCHIHQNPGATTGIFLSRVNGFRVSNNRIVKNTSNGIRFYETKSGSIQDNYISEHFGSHANSIALYEGCANIVVERNHVYNSSQVTLNRNAENIVFRNNLFDMAGNCALNVGMWCTGTVGGRNFKNIQFLNNTFVNTNHDVVWSTAILGQQRGSPSSPKGLVIKNNILDRISEDLPGVIENNIYTREVEAKFMGPGCKVVTDLHALFVDPDNGDWRLKEGSPAINAGADLRPPPPVPAKTKAEKLDAELDDIAKLDTNGAGALDGLKAPKPEIAPVQALDPSAYFVTDDIKGTPRPQGKAFDIGAYEFKAE